MATEAPRCLVAPIAKSLSTAVLCYSLFAISALMPEKAASQEPPANCCGDAQEAQKPRAGSAISSM